MNLNKSAGKWLGADVLEHGSAVIITAEDSMNDIKRRLHTRDPDGSRRAAAEGRLFIVPLQEPCGFASILKHVDHYFYKRESEIVENCLFIQYCLFIHRMCS